jgi:hypothetical protein
MGPRLRRFRSLVVRACSPTRLIYAWPGAPNAGYTGWQLARAFGASIHNHNVGGPNVVIDAAADTRNGTDWSDVTFIHATR